MKIIQLDEETRPAYEAFLQRKPFALLYHSLKYRDFLVSFLKAEAEYYLAQDSMNNVCGVLPLMSVTGPYGTIYNSLPFYGSNGGIVSDNEQASSALLAFYNNFVTQPNVAAATLISNPIQADSYQGLVHNFQDYRLGQWTDISSNDDHANALMEKFHYKTRNMIRKAQKNDICVEIDNNQFPILAQIHQENMAALAGIPKPPAFFKAVIDGFQPNSDYQLYVAKIGGKGEIIAALLVFYYNQTVEYFMPVIKVAYRSWQPLSLLIFQAMVAAAEQGYRWWNWGGTWASQEGVYRFKKRWAAVDYHYHYYTQLNNQALRQLNKETLLRLYPNFFVVPFQALTPSQSEQTAS